MGSFWNAAFTIVLFIVWIIAGGFITQASVYLTSYRNTDDKLHAAYWYAFWAAFATWFLVAAAIIVVILASIGVIALFSTGVGEAAVVAEGGADIGIAAESGLEAESALEAGTSGSTTKQLKSALSKVKGGISWVIIIFLLIALVLVNVTGVLSVLTAINIINSPNFDNTDDKLVTSYHDAIVAASLSLGAGCLLIIGIIVYFILLEKRKSKEKKIEKEIEGRKQTILGEVNKLKVQSTRQKLSQGLK